MNAQVTHCPAKDRLAAFGRGKLDAAKSETVSRHLQTCAECRQFVASVSGDKSVRLSAGGKALPAEPRDAKTLPVSGATQSTSRSPSGQSVSLARKSSETSPGSARRLNSPSSEPLIVGANFAGPPELLNRPEYELLKELERGAMGAVYLARNRRNNQPEVLKVISRTFLDRPESLKRLLQELREATHLSHPNIAIAYQVLQLGENLVLTTEYLQGQDLYQVVQKRGQLPIVNSTFYANQVALGLQHAFEKGMVHRDIKPSNLILVMENKKHIVKILGFGMSRAISEKSNDRGEINTEQMPGTPAYIAPEQTIDAQKADIRADIYSLGCTLYYLLAGKPPFDGNSREEILRAHHSSEARPLNRLRPDVPVELAAVVSRMMAKNPSRRYQTPAEVAKALTPFFKAGQAGSPAIRAESSPIPRAVELPLPPAPKIETPIATAEATANAAPPPPSGPWNDDPFAELQNLYQEMPTEAASSAGRRSPRPVHESLGFGSPSRWVLWFHQCSLPPCTFSEKRPRGL